MFRTSFSLSRHVVQAAMLLAGAVALGAPGGAFAAHLGPWQPALSIESMASGSSEVNTVSLDGCPIQSPDGLSLYMATNRPGGLGGLDIWVASRASTATGFGEPVNLGAPINSTADDFCPTPVRGNRLYFVSTRVDAAACGGADIYLARNNPSAGWTDPVNLGCMVNSAAAEAGPSYFESDGRAWLYFSSGPDIMASNLDPDGGYGAAVPVAELNSAAGDFRPNVRKGGLEIVFDSNREGTIGGQDLYFATRKSVDDPWSTPINGGGNVNTGANETRGSFSWDGSTLLFGRTPGPEGSTDIFVTTRD